MLPVSLPFDPHAMIADSNYDCCAARIIAPKRLGNQITPPPSKSRPAPTAITTILRLRPLVRSDIAPIARPTTAIGMMIQLAQPSSGIKAGMTRIRAMTPMRIEMILRIETMSRLRRRIARGQRVDVDTVDGLAHHYRASTAAMDGVGVHTKIPPLQGGICCLPRSLCRTAPGSPCSFALQGGLIYS